MTDTSAVARDIGVISALVAACCSVGAAWLWGGLPWALLAIALWFALLALGCRELINAERGR